MSAALQKLEESTSVKDQAIAISALLKHKELHKAAKSPAFVTMVNRLIHAGSVVDSADRLLALALLSKLGVLLKGGHPKIREGLGIALKVPPPPMQDLIEPDDRYYFAKFWNFSAPPWAINYLAHAAVFEEGSESVRKVCIEGLLSLAGSLNSAIETLITPLRQLKFETENPSKSKGRRLRRILSCLKEAFVSKAQEAGESAGVNLAALLNTAFEDTGVPAASRVQEELASQTMALLHEIVRARLVWATNSKTYRAIEVVRYWFSDIDWERFVENSLITKFVGRDIEEALEILVRAGAADNDLFRFLSIVSGGIDHARERALNIITRNPGLSEDLIAWLQGKPPRKKSVLATESQATRMDEGLAALIMDAISVVDAAEQVQHELVPGLRVIGAGYLPAIERFVGRALALSSAIQTLAAERALRIVGIVGSVVEFSPPQHELTESAPFGTPHVRIIRPAVMAQLEDGSYRVVRKALVEPA
jgi:hypothetical protein